MSEIYNSDFIVYEHFNSNLPAGTLGTESTDGAVAVAGVLSEESAGGLTGELAGPLPAEHTQEIQIVK